MVEGRRGVMEIGGGRGAKALYAMGENVVQGAYLERPCIDLCLEAEMLASGHHCTHNPIIRAKLSLAGALPQQQNLQWA